MKQRVSWTAVAAALFVAIGVVAAVVGYSRDDMLAVVTGGVVAVSAVACSMLALRDR